jgi:transporter family-2 protein
MNFALYGYLLAFAAGISFVMQQTVNANLRGVIGSPWWTGFVSYLGGTLVMLVVALALREPLPSLAAMRKAGAIDWSGGFFGAIYIAVSILLLPRLGAATVVGLIVAGQMIGSLAFDQFGLFGLQVHEIGFARLTGAALLVAGVLLIRA